MESNSEILRALFESRLGEDVVSKLSDAQIKKLSEYYYSLPPKEREKVDEEIANKRGEFFDIARGMAGIMFVELNDAEKKKYTPNASAIEQGPMRPPAKAGGDVYSPRALNGSKFFGEDRYEKYAEELAQDGTLDGDRLTIEERKKGVKAYRKGKIDFKTFVDKVLSAKKAQSVGSSGGPKSIGSGGGALVIRKKNISADDIKSGSSVETEQNLDEILKGIDSIRETLKKEEELKKKQASDSKKSEERKKRKAKEEKLEGSVFKGLAKQTKKVFAPVKSILDRMIDFFTKILIGRFLVKLIDWMTDGKNQKKLEALGFLLEKTWPALVTAFVLFGTAFGGLIRGILGLAIKFTSKLLVAA